ncbi:MAG: SDR family oxidoreductase [Methylophaga sp.]|nr:SDR family oxidoreductase [Methylophaga sp.]
MSIHVNELNKVSITGATGFIGLALVKHLLESKTFDVSAILRQKSELMSAGVEQFEAGDLSELSQADNRNALARHLQHIDTVIHMAARVHVMNDTSADPLAEFRKINVTATLELAKVAAEAGVKRFVFLSSVKVNGESTQPAMPFTENDSPLPEDDYARSKQEAEMGLREIAEETGLEIVIIRLPLVYGPGVKGNFAAMMRWLQKGVPLPLGAVHNQRSLVALDNLVDFIQLCITRPDAANQTFLIADGEDVSTTELLRRVAIACGKRPCLLPVPVSWMRLAAKSLGKTAVADRLFCSLQVDISKARHQLGWKPVVTMQQQLDKCR